MNIAYTKYEVLEVSQVRDLACTLFFNTPKNLQVWCLFARLVRTHFDQISLISPTKFWKFSVLLSTLASCISELRWTLRKNLGTRNIYSS